MNLKRYVTVTVLFTLLSFVVSAQAGLTFYTDRSAWESAVSGAVVTEDFDSVAPYFLADGINPAGLLEIELINIFSTSEYNSIDDGSFTYLDIDGTPYYRGRCSRGDPDAVINLVLSSPVSAFGGDFKLTNDADGLWLEVNGEQYAFGDEELLSSGDGSGFLGFISTSDFSTVTFFDPVEEDLANLVLRSGESFGLDNVSFAVPEPVTMVLLGLGGLLLRKRKKV